MTRLAPPPVPADERLALERGQHAQPHAILGAHAAEAGGRPGVVVRAFHPVGVRCEVLAAGQVVALQREGEGGLFSAFLPGATLPSRHRLRWRFPEGGAWEVEDAYRFVPTTGDVDLHLFHEGTHRRPWHAFGARFVEVDGVAGVAFATWAPEARAVSVAGDFTHWDDRLYPMRRVGGAGAWELFVPGLGEGESYKLSILGADGVRRLKADPWARFAEVSPATASRTFRSRHAWGDDAWMRRRRHADPAREPMAACEVHLGSWRRGPRGEKLPYREIAPLLAAHCRRLGFTHVELMPVTEHPFEASWGYQVSGYHSPTSRHGDPDDFRALVDHLHREGIGVLLDWVPGHFVKDDFGLYRFDGSPLFEHAHPQRGEHPDWGTAIFNLGRHEVRSFLLGSALWWLEELHLDGLRVDAVASMLYLDYSRKEGEWIPNRHGGRENLEAVDFLRALNRIVREEAPGCVTIAEESTAWPGVTAPVEHGGLGFTFKWNMGWMHDSLAYFARDPVHRRHHHDQLTFAMLYESHERFVNPLSHDEFVHGKGSLLARMPGDDWQRFAHVRTLLAYQWLRPGKKLLFMGTELAPPHEWRHDEALPWELAAEPARAGLAEWLAALGALYRDRPALWRRDHEPDGFRWIDCHDRAASVVSFERRDGASHVVVVLNLTPEPRTSHRIGAPERTRYRVALDSDELRFGGSGMIVRREAVAEAIPWQGRDQSIVIDLPPLSVLVLLPESEGLPARDPVDELAERLGIEPGYADLGGTRHATSPETRDALLAALGHPVADALEAERRLRDLRPPGGESSPSRCLAPAEKLGDRRASGVSVNAWSLWRREGWGAGDLGDVARVAEWAASRGADFLALSPLHLLRAHGGDPSPYFPSSRRALHPLYLDVDAVPERASCAAARDLIASRGFRDRLEAVRAAPRVDHAGVLALKLEALAPLHAEFERSARGERAGLHDEFVREGGDVLLDVATYLALEEAQRANGHASWWTWDAALLNPVSREVAAFREQHAERVRFHQWVQFELDRQLAEAARRARAAGMRLGLMTDLAVGCAPDGADAWRDAPQLATGASLGAPPDPLGPLGQDWSLAPINPHAAERGGHALWRDVVRHALRHAGALRADHAFGLVRQFWIPRGRSPAHGAYVRQPVEALFGTLADESRRADALVIGEDLGTRPPGFDEVMRRFGALSLRLLLFEREPDGTFRPPSAAPQHALLAFGTHDLPPILGWWQGRDLDLRDALGSWADAAAREAARTDRARSRDQLLALLRAEGVLPAGTAGPEPAALVAAVHALLLRSPSRLIACQLDDLLGETEPVNLPGVPPDLHPSWTRRQRIPVDDLDADPFARATR